MKHGASKLSDNIMILTKNHKFPQKSSQELHNFYIYSKVMHLYNIYPKFIMVNPSEMWIKPQHSGDNQTCVQHSHLPDNLTLEILVDWFLL